MDVRRLKHFIVAAEEHSINRAARLLHMTQPPLTRHIQGLEEELGVVLFNRTNSGIELTQAGKELLVHARAIVSQVDFASDRIRRVAAGQAGRLEIGVYGSALLYAIPNIVSSFTATHPNVEVSFNVMQKMQQIDALKQGRILIAFDRYLPETPGLQVDVVFREKMVVALHAKNPLASKEFVTIHDLKGEPFIGEAGASILSTISALFVKYGAELHLVHRAPDVIKAAILVSCNLGSALVPESMGLIQIPNVLYKPLHTEEPVTVDLHCAYRQDEKSPLLAEILHCVRSFQ